MLLMTVCTPPRQGTPTTTLSLCTDHASTHSSTPGFGGFPRTSVTTAASLPAACAAAAHPLAHACEPQPCTHTHRQPYAGCTRRATGTPLESEQSGIGNGPQQSKANMMCSQRQESVASGQPLAAARARTFVVYRGRAAARALGSLPQCM